MTPLEASTHYFLEAWRFFCERLPNGTVDRFPGVVASFGHIPIPFFNLFLLDSPPRDCDDLERRIQVAVDYGAGSGLPWAVALCEEWMPEGSSEVCTEAGLAPIMKLIAMKAEKLEPPSRPLPEISYDESRSVETAHLLARINGEAYGMPEEVVGSLAEPGLWDEKTHLAIGYCGGEPATCSATIVLSETCYVGWVATLPQHQRKGYANAVMRRSLESAQRASGYSSSWLHATEAGFPVYRSMGYEATGHFILYMPETQAH